MQPIYLFDVDGTLTPARQPMAESFERFFMDWSKGKLVYLISGSDLQKIEQQLPEEVMSRCAGVFSCMANRYYRDGELIYSNDFKPSHELLQDLEEITRESDYPVKVGRHVEVRPGMINFSIVGRNASKEQRKSYAAYDNGESEREKIVEKIGSKYPELEFAVGGEISIDIYPKGRDKAQAIDVLRLSHGASPLIFMGDRTEYPGNDHGIVKELQKYENCQWYQVDSWEDTQVNLARIEQKKTGNS